MHEYKLTDISPEMSFLEMLDQLNETLFEQGEEPIAFEHDCREGICGKCSLVINGVPHGNEKATTTCQLFMSSFNDDDTIYIEPWRANAFPVVKDLVVDRTAFEKVIESAGFKSDDISARSFVNKNDTTGVSDICNGCGACVAACANASAMLFVAAKANQLPQYAEAHIDHEQMTLNMVAEMDNNGFGECTNNGTCTSVCPKEVPLENISRLNRKYLRASILKW